MSVNGFFHKDIRRQENASLRQTFVTITLLFFDDNEWAIITELKRQKYLLIRRLPRKLGRFFYA